MSPSTAIWVTTTASAPTSANRCERLGPLDAGALGPAADGDLAAPHVEPERHRLAGRDRGQEVRVLHRGGAHHDAGDAGVGEGSGGFGAAHSPAGLHRHVDRGRDGGDQLAVHRLAGAGGVEVDRVDPARAGGDEGLGHRDRVVAVDALAIEVALDELHDLPAAEVDGRVEVHQASDGRTRAAVDERREDGEAGAARLLRVELRGPHVLALDGGDHRPAVVAGGDHERVVGVGGVRVHEVRPGRIGGAAAGARDRRGDRAGSTASAAASRRRGAAARCPGGCRGPWRRGSPRTPRRASASRCRCRGTGGPASTASWASSSRPWRAQRLHAATEGTDAGEHDAVGVADQPGIGGEPGVGAEVLERLLGRAQVADLVVEDGDQRHRVTPRPWWTGCRRPRRARRRAGSGPRP